MNGRTMTWLACAGSLLVGGMVSAQPMGVPMGRWWERPKVAEELGLTPEQTQKLDAVALEQATSMVDLKGAVEKAEIALKAAADQQPFDARRARDAFAAMQQARVKLEAQRFEMLLKVRETLNPDQWKRLRELARTMREHRGERGKGGPPEGAPQPRGPRSWPD